MTFSSKVERALLALNGQRPRTLPDALYLFGTLGIGVRGNSLMIEAAREFADKGGTIALPEVSKSEGYCGFAAAKEQLRKAGVAEGRIIGVPLVRDDGFVPNVEALSLVVFAKQEKWRSVFICTPTLTLCRAWLLTLTAAEQRYPKLKIFKMKIESGRRDRKELVRERELTDRGITKGSISSPEKLFSYLINHQS